MATLPENMQQHEIEIHEDPTLALRRIIMKYLAYWPWFIVSFVVFLVLAYGYLYTLTPQYLITANILVQDKKLGSPTAVLEEFNLFQTTKVVENEMEILRSYNLMEEVVDALNLQVNYYEKKNRWQTTQLYGDLPVRIEIISSTWEMYYRPMNLYFDDNDVIFNEKRYPRDALITEPYGTIRLTTTIADSLPLPTKWNIKNPIIVEFSYKASKVESLHGSIQTSLSKNTSIINLSILSPVPKLGMDILNQLMESYSNASINDKNNMAKLTLDFIDERILLVAEDLKKAERDVEQYRTQQGVIDINTESSIFLHNIQQNTTQLNQVRTQLDVLNQVEQFVVSSNDASFSAPSTAGLANDPILTSLITSLQSAQSERRKMLITVQPGNPRVVAIDDQILSLKGQLMDNIQSMRRSLETTQRNLGSESGRMKSLVNSMPRKERELVDFTRQQGIVNQLFVYLLSKREETAISHAATVADSRIINAARSTLHPVLPRKMVILAMFLCIGLAIPAGFIWLMDALRTTIQSRNELDNVLKPSIVGEISFVKKANKIVVIDNVKSRQAEQLRSLRTNIQFMQAGGGVKVILITSNISGEGKSFLSANLATAFAVLGKKTVILGFDLRKAGLHTLFGINNEKGLSNYLAGQADLGQIIRRTEFSENLHIITCGYMAPNPQELLLGPMLPQLFAHLRNKYDYIIIDTPPIGLMSDAMIINEFSDITLYVIRQNFTPKDHIRQMNELYVNRRLKNMGIVVNGIKDDKWDGYGYGAKNRYHPYYINEK